MLNIVAVLERYNNADTDKGLECIQIESDSSVLRTDESFNFQQGSKSFLTVGLSHDGTPSKNITVSGCIFDGVIRGIGTHIPKKYASKCSDNIKIINSIFTNIEDSAIYFQYTSNIVLTNIYIKSCKKLNGEIAIKDFSYISNNVTINGK